jgi:immune inhibitor A
VELPPEKLTSVVPPPPGMEDRLAARGGLPPLDRLIASPSPVKARLQQGTENLLAIMVDFSDRPATVTNLAVFDSLLFAAPVAGRGSVRDYFDAVSYGQVTLVTVNLPSTTGWQRAPATLAYYANGQWGWGAYPQNAGRMVEQVIPLVDPLVDFSQYDNDGDMLVDSLLVIHAGTGAEFSTNANDIWSHASSIAMMGGTPPMLDGVVLDRYVTVPEYWNPGQANPGATDMTIGVICHEIAHGLWGLPDLWDLDGSSQGIGQWGLMAAGDWNGPAIWNPFTNQWVAGGSSPAWPDPFSRVVAGFDSYWTLFGPLDGVVLSPVETAANAILRLKSGQLRAQEHFFLENRQQILGSYDEWLPGSGVLIWHVDEAFWSIYGGPNNNTECRTIPHCQGACAGPGTHYLVALEQADGLDNLEWAANWGDAGDPFPGNSNRTFWRPWPTVNLNPDSGSWYDTNCQASSCIDVTGIACIPLGNCSLSVQQASCSDAEADLGDAPASANHSGLPMTAYAPSVQASFPTVWGLGLGGPRHHWAHADAWLGPTVTGELDADLLPDNDPMTNIDPPTDSSNRDNLLIGPEDDGVLLPIPLVDCNGSGLSLAVTVVSPLVYMPMPRYVNVWFDWNSDGDWADTLSCPGGFQAPEWAVRNQVQVSGPGSFWLNPQFLPKIRLVKQMPYETWMRVSIAEMPAPAPQDGRGPMWGYDLGETEDYYLYLQPSLAKTANLSGDPKPGDLVTYQIQINSVGTVIAPGAAISDVLPAGVEFVSCSGSCTYTPATRTVWWGLALVPNQLTIFDLVVQYTGTHNPVTNVAYLIWAGTIWQTAGFRFGPMNRVYLPIVSHNR